MVKVYLTSVHHPRRYALPFGELTPRCRPVTVEFKLDWSALRPLIRAKVEISCRHRPRDGRTWLCSITDSTQTVTVRVLVSATNSGNPRPACYLREHLSRGRQERGLAPSSTSSSRDRDRSKRHITRRAWLPSSLHLRHERGRGPRRARRPSHTVARRSSQDSSGVVRLAGVRAGGPFAAPRRRTPWCMAAARRSKADSPCDGRSSARNGRGIRDPLPTRPVVIPSPRCKITEAVTRTRRSRPDAHPSASGDVFSGSVEADERAAALSGPREARRKRLTLAASRIAVRRERRYAAGPRRKHAR